MFSRIRYAAKVLSYSPPKTSEFDRPDIVFEDVSPPEVTKASMRIGTFIEILVVSIVVGAISGPTISRLFPGKPQSGLMAITGMAASFLAIMSHKLIRDLNDHIRLKLKIGEKIAPFFGHKIMRAVRTLKG
jgi:hypothetical protein